MSSHRAKNASPRLLTKREWHTTGNSQADTIAKSVYSKLKTSYFQFICPQVATEQRLHSHASTFREKVSLFQQGQMHPSKNCLPLVSDRGIRRYNVFLPPFGTTGTVVYRSYFPACPCRNAHMLSRIVQSWVTILVSGKLPTYRSLKPTLTLTFHLGQNVDLGEGYMG